MEEFMNRSIATIIGIAGLCVGTLAAAQVTFYAGEGFHGPSFRADRPIGNFDRLGFNDRASSAVVDGGYWQACEDAGFNGRCVVLRPGSYPSLADIGLNNQISSVRPVEAAAYYRDRDRSGYPTA